MINVILAGVGGQGTVLAAKVLAAAAAMRGWQVRTAETIGMAQRGGSVISHVRIADRGEEIHAPLITRGTANLIIAFEPGEAARALPYLARSGTVVSATTPIEPVSMSLKTGSYDASEIMDNIQLSLYNAMAKSIATERGKTSTQAKLVSVDDEAILQKLGGNRKVLNSLMLAEAVKANCLPITLEELAQAVAACVKPEFVDINLAVIFS